MCECGPDCADDYPVVTIGELMLELLQELAGDDPKRLADVARLRREAEAA